VTTVQAIETQYAGCRFRSRLEARWAVALDTAKIRWEYEPEGFETPFGRYLPDFRLTSFARPRWLEVKPEGYTHDANDTKRWGSLVESTGTMLIVACGLSERTIVIIGTHAYGHQGHPGIIDEAAVNAGRSARFEFGESGTRAPVDDWPRPATWDVPERFKRDESTTGPAATHQVSIAHFRRWLDSSRGFLSTARGRTADGQIEFLRHTAPIVGLLPTAYERLTATQELAAFLGMDQVEVSRAVRAVGEAGR